MRVIFLRSETLGAKNRQGFAKVPEPRCPCAPTHKVRVSCETPMEVSIRSLLRSKSLACRALTRRAPRRYSTARPGLGSKVSPKAPDSRAPGRAPVPCAPVPGAIFAHGGKFLVAISKERSKVPLRSQTLAAVFAKVFSDSRQKKWNLKLRTHRSVLQPGEDRASSGAPNHLELPKSGREGRAPRLYHGPERGEDGSLQEEEWGPASGAFRAPATRANRTPSSKNFFGILRSEGPKIIRFQSEITVVRNPSGV